MTNAELEKKVASLEAQLAELQDAVRRNSQETNQALSSAQSVREEMVREFQKMFTSVNDSFKKLANPIGVSRG